ncbi:hypothetical protein OG874_36875 [Nocardia sp. NBC_00565]|uniref:hypothetical protein n=1 Tax=Nocardia sp. NBC_00565 TaxID=2975993 RepID=UPI002E821F20|nr:hypothetical protein [Nocardia sp. NBC_00565]WUC02250.1 hypothetical protein OG874_36875 [Nocardia sp. NBC_00565]
MSEPQRYGIDPAVEALLAAFHADTRFKLELAAVDSSAVCERADGSLWAVGEDGWLTEYTDPDNAGPVSRDGA